MFRTFVLVVLLTFLAGCSADSFDRLRDAKDRVQVVRDEAAAAVDTLEAEVAELPADDPVRLEAEHRLATARTTLDRADDWIDRADHVLLAAETGGWSDPELREAFRDVPYGPLALAVVGIGAGIWQRLRAERAHGQFEQVVRSVDAAFPQRSNDEKKLLRQWQDAPTRQAVASVRKR